MPRVCSGCITNKRDNHIRALLEEVKPQSVFGGFEEILQVLESEQQLSNFRSFADTLLVALDGTEYFGASKIDCPHCSSRNLNNGEEYYFHSVMTPVIVCSGRTQVIRLVPELIVPQDGDDKLSLRECC